VSLPALAAKYLQLEYDYRACDASNMFAERMSLAGEQLGRGLSLGTAVCGPGTVDWSCGSAQKKLRISVRSTKQDEAFNRRIEQLRDKIPG